MDGLAGSPITRSVAWDNMNMYIFKKKQDILVGKAYLRILNIIVLFEYVAYATSANVKSTIVSRSGPGAKFVI